MSDIERIKQEIERLKHNTPNAYDLSRFMLLEEIESFINSLPEESGCEVNFTTKSEDLEEEIQRAYYDKSLYDADNIDRTDFNCIAHHFAEWQKQQIMKDAVECIVEDWCGDSPEVTIPLNPQDFKIGEKVKIIIVKDEQQ